MSSQAVVAEVRRIIAERYVLPGLRPALDAILARGLASGRYDVGEPEVLAQRINADLEAVGRDRHLNFAFDPSRAGVLAAARNEAAPDPSARERQVRTANHGVTELRLLPGNIRYLDYDGFMWIGSETASALELAMRFIAGGDAVIIDLRHNGGGDPLAIQYIISHFLPSDRPLFTSYGSGGAVYEKMSTLAKLPAGRLIGKPLYVLISGDTASAAEAFAGTVKGFRIGELVGKTTAGAGYRNIVVPIDGRYVLSVSAGRAVLESTGRDWEGTGIAATIQADPAAALETAQLHAVRRLAASAPAIERLRLEALAEVVTAGLEPRAPLLPLDVYAGRYGERSITVVNGRLHYQRGTRSRIPLIPLGGNRFAIDNDPATHIAFVADGRRVTAFDISQDGRPPQGHFERTQ